MRFEIPFFGHKNIRSFHTRTIEITMDSSLTLSGDCLVGTNASVGCNEIPHELKQKLCDSNTKITILIEVESHQFKIIGQGHESLVLTHPHDIVIRKSDFVCPRTLAIKCDNASDSIPREMINLLQNPDTKGLFIIEVE